MPDWNTVAESLIAGVLTGGTSVLATLTATYRNMRKRLAAIEATLGEEGDTLKEPTGLFRSVKNLAGLVERLQVRVEDDLKALKEELEHLKDDVYAFRRRVDSWDADPPDWATRLVRRQTSGSFIDLDAFENRLDDRLRRFDQRLKTMESFVERLQEERKRASMRIRQQEDLSRKFVTKEEYEADDDKRVRDIVAVKENLATANGLIRGLMATMGLIDSDKDGKKQ